MDFLAHKHKHDANIQMNTNETNKDTNKIIHKELSYKITGILFRIRI